MFQALSDHMWHVAAILGWTGLAGSPQVSEGCCVCQWGEKGEVRAALFILTLSQSLPLQGLLAPFRTDCFPGHRDTWVQSRSLTLGSSSINLTSVLPTAGDWVMTFSLECLVQLILKRPPTPTSHSTPSKRLWGGRKEPVETAVGRPGEMGEGKA